MDISAFRCKNKEHTLRLREYHIDHEITVPVLVFPQLDSVGVAGHCITTRMGGVSSGIFESMNMNFGLGDQPEAVSENYRRMAGVFALSPDHFVLSKQTHTDHVIRVGKAEMGYGVTVPLPYTDVDGLITNEPGIILTIQSADCVPLLFVDPVHKAVGASHSGWKGTVARIGQRTIERMHEEFGTDPADLYAAVGPSICQDCYEVSADVAMRFAEEFKGHEDEILISKGNGKYQLDLWQSNRIIMEESGIPADHISVTDICTCCNSSLLFSHRASKGRRGTFASMICLK